ncbi:MAG: FAD:protein FMN transferase [Ruminococcus sp.]|nr:FAD:protein FMN transferase [Ruminococcus sp.]
MPLLDTAVTITSHGELPVSSIEAVLTEVSDMTESSFAFESPYISETSDITEKTVALNERFGNEIDIRIGALTRLWGISTDNPKIPTETEIAAALSDKSYLDLGAVAKGYALDKAYEALKSADSNTESGYAIISAESSILLYGKKPESLFKTAIKSPFIPEELVGYIETDAAFISTSGGSERYFEADGKRYSHILDPFTGYPVDTDLASVTVIVPTSTPDGGIMSDFLSTLIFIRGSDGLKDFDDNDAFSFIAIDKNGNIHGNHELKAI